MIYCIMFYFMCRQKEDGESFGNDETELIPKEPEINLLAKDPSDEGSRLIARKPLAPDKGSYTNLS